eukprot:scaffold13079_cov21-Tisochrysis_lutea.AAC.2
MHVGPLVAVRAQLLDFAVILALGLKQAAVSASVVSLGIVHALGILHAAVSAHMVSLGIVHALDIIHAAVSASMVSLGIIHAQHKRPPASPISGLLTMLAHHYSADVAAAAMPPVQTLAWLICKVQQARQSLSYQLSNMEAVAQTAYVVSFLSEYLPERW